MAIECSNQGRRRYARAATLAVSLGALLSVLAGGARGATTQPAPGKSSDRPDAAAAATPDGGAASAGATNPEAERPAAAAAVDEGEAGAVKLIDRTTAVEYQRTMRDEHLAGWRKRVPQVRLVRVPSTADGARQKVLFYDSGARAPRPLLVVLHSWSADYQQNLNIPFAEAAIANDWVFIHPDFRGPNQRPEATASELAVQDVLDAVDYAREHAAVDRERIYLVGYSGGAMKALLLAGRHPELWAGVVAWGAVYDIPDWYGYNRGPGHNAHYTRTIALSCGGAPRAGSGAETECRKRSPSAYLDAAADRVPILIAHGLRDTTVPPRHGVRAFEQLAAAGDHFTDEQRNIIDTQHRMPPELQAAAPASALYDRAGVPLLLERRSRRVTLNVFDGQHDMAYNPTIRWLAQQHR